MQGFSAEKAQLFEKIRGILNKRGALTLHQVAWPGHFSVY